VLTHIEKVAHRAAQPSRSDEREGKRPSPEASGKQAVAPSGSKRTASLGENRARPEDVPDKHGSPQERGYLVRNPYEFSSAADALAGD
jgi:hypothetical protein